jgi:hypothetical protein
MVEDQRGAGERRAGAQMWIRPGSIVAVKRRRLTSFFSSIHPGNGHFFFVVHYVPTSSVVMAAPIYI